MPITATPRASKAPIAQFVNTPVAPVASMSTPYKAIIVGPATQVYEKTNGSEYVFFKAEILEGPGIGLIALATRTVMVLSKTETDSEGNPVKVYKSQPDLDQEVTLYHTKLPSTKTVGKFQHFWEISMGDGLQIASQDDFDAVM